MQLSEFLQHYVPFSDEEIKDICSRFSKIEVKKNEILVNQGDVCHHLYFIDKGMGRSYYLKEDGKEITQWFFAESVFMSSADSFFNQSPSFYYLEILEDSFLHSISFQEMDVLLNKYHKMERFARLLSISMLSKIVEKLNAIQFQTAKERYDYLISEYPDICQRVALGHIASYLGMTQETLSRIRRNDFLQK